MSNQSQGIIHYVDSEGNHIKLRLFTDGTLVIYENGREYSFHELNYKSTKILLREALKLSVEHRESAPELVSRLESILESFEIFNENLDD